MNMKEAPEDLAAGVRQYYGETAVERGSAHLGLLHSRYAPFFNVAGDRSRHFGLFDRQPEAAGADVAGGGSDCC